MVLADDEATRMLPHNNVNVDTDDKVKEDDNDNDETANKQLEVKALTCSIIENQMAQMTPIKNNRDRQRLAHLDERTR